MGAVGLGLLTLRAWQAACRVSTHSVSVPRHPLASARWTSTKGPGRGCGKKKLLTLAGPARALSAEGRVPRRLCLALRARVPAGRERCSVRPSIMP